MARELVWLENSSLCGLGMHDVRLDRSEPRPDDFGQTSRHGEGRLRSARV
jgi:hypothetical protein